MPHETAKNDRRPVSDGRAAGSPGGLLGPDVPQRRLLPGGRPDNSAGRGRLRRLGFRGPAVSAQALALPRRSGSGAGVSALVPGSPAGKPVRRPLHHLRELRPVLCRGQNPGPARRRPHGHPLPAGAAPGLDHSLGRLPRGQYHGCGPGLCAVFDRLPGHCGCGPGILADFAHRRAAGAAAEPLGPGGQLLRGKPSGLVAGAAHGDSRERGDHPLAPGGLRPPQLVRRPPDLGRGQNQHPAAGHHHSLQRPRLERLSAVGGSGPAGPPARYRPGGPHLPGLQRDRLSPRRLPGRLRGQHLVRRPPVGLYRPDL